MPIPSMPIAIVMVMVFPAPDANVDSDACSGLSINQWGAQKHSRNT